MEGLGAPVIHDSPLHPPQIGVQYEKETMRLGMKLAFAVAIALVLLPLRSAFAADDLDKVLRRLDVAARNFHSTSADFEFDTIVTDPVYDKDVQTGIVYYQRNDGVFQMGVHIAEHNNKPAPKVYTYGNGSFKLFEPGINQVTTYTKANKFESYVMLGFGASGKDLEAKWDIKYLGSENLLDGKATIQTEKLELVAKDPEVRKNLTKVTIWVDPDRAVSLRQELNFPSNTRISIYSNIKVNVPKSIPGDAFTFKTDPKTQYSTQ
jgi:outer membrane lipoprotein-sorting protein